MTAEFDKIIVLKDEKSRVIGVVIHDQESHHQVHYSLSEMDAEEIVAMHNKTI